MLNVYVDIMGNNVCVTVSGGFATGNVGNSPGRNVIGGARALSKKKKKKKVASSKKKKKSPVF